MGLFKKRIKEFSVLSPVDGNTTDLIEVPDQVFSQKMMGDGLAVDWTGGDVYAPISGEIASLITPSCHAFGIRHESGMEILVHVGLETVNLKGEGFKALKHQGDHVEAGEKILEIDFDLLKAKKVNLMTPIIVLNSDYFKIKKSTTDYSLKHGDELFVCEEV